MSNTSAADEHGLPEQRLSITQVVRKVADEFATDGTPLPVPPDREVPRLDQQFWKRVEEQLKADGRPGHNPPSG
jgi:hypothetical protein